MVALELAHDDYGAAGPPFVILHGLLGSARNWTAIAKQLGETGRVSVLDLRNHGRSPWSDSMGFDDMAGDVAAFVLRHGIAPATVIGHSLGGKVAMRLALLRPELVARLVVVDVAPVAYGHSFVDYIAALRRVDLTQLSRRADADRALQEAIPAAGLRSFLLQNLVQTGTSFAWRVNLAALETQMGVMMDFPAEPDEAYRGPTLFLSGARSDYVRPEHRPLIERLFPAAQYAVVADAGHWVHAEQPTEFLARLREFLDTG